MNSPNHVGAVIIGSDFQALGIIRCLAEKGVPCFLIEHELGISRFSRYCKRKKIDYSLLSSSQNFVDSLIKIAKEENLKGWVLYPNNDELVKLVSINRDKLQEWFKIIVPPWEIVKKFYYKQNAYKIAEKISIPIPKMYTNNIEKLLKEELIFPIVLKPTYREKYYPKTKKKAIRVDNKEQLITEYKNMNSIIDSSEIIVQEMIEGGTKNLFSYATFFTGEQSIGGMTAVRTRQHPMDFGQASTYAESVHIPELYEMGNRILKEMGYFGVAEVEFMKDDKENVYKFIEVNGRFWGWHTLAMEAGINFPFILFNYMLGKDISVPEARIGVKWVRLLTDVPTVIIELFGRRFSLKEYFRTMRGKIQFAVFSFRDPLPFFMELLLIPYLWIKRGF
jgi:predicted ATP-grasp superfamily ATP-dependent carboligase